MAFVEKKNIGDRLLTSLKAGLEDQLDSNAVGGAIGDLIKQSLMTGDSGRVIGMQKEYLDNIQAQEQAIAKQAELQRKQEAEYAKFTKQELFKAGLEDARFKRNKKIELGQKNLDTAISMAEQAAKNRIKFDNVFTEPVLRELDLSDNVPILESIYSANTPEEEKVKAGQLGKFTKAYMEYQKLKSENSSLIANKTFMEWYSGIYGTTDAQNYERYLEDMKKNKPQEEPMSFYDFISSESAKSEAKDDLKVKTALKNIDNIRKGITHPSEYISNYNGGQLPSANSGYKPTGTLLNAVAIVQARMGKGYVLADHKFLYGAVQNYNRKNKEKQEAIPDEQQGQRRLSLIASSDFLQMGENLKLIPPTLVSKDIKPKSLIVPNMLKDNAEYNDSVARLYLLKVQDLAKKIAQVDNTKIQDEIKKRLNLSDDEFNSFQSSYDQEADRFKNTQESDVATVKNYGSIIKKMLQETGTFNSVKNMMEHMTKPRLQNSTLEAGDTETTNIEYDPSILTTFAPLIAATGANTLSLEQLVKDNNGDKRPAVVIEDASGNKITLVGQIIGMSKFAKKSVFDATRRINDKSALIDIKDIEYMTDDSRFPVYGADMYGGDMGGKLSPGMLFRQIYRHSETEEVFQDQDNFEKAKLKLARYIAPKSTIRKTGVNLHLGATILDTLLDSGREFKRDDAGIITANDSEVAGYLQQDVKTAAGRVFKASSNEDKKTTKQFRDSTDLLQKAITKAGTMMLLIETITPRQEFLGKEKEINIDDVQPILVSELQQLNRTPAVGIAGTIQSIMTGGKLIINEIMNAFGPKEGEFGADKKSDDLANGFGLNVADGDERFVTGNQSFMRSGIHQAIAEESKKLNLQLEQLKAKGSKLTQRELDIHLTKRKMLWERISLTYMLAGFVQGDQAGGRTISNEDFSNVRDALWGNPLVETFAGFRDQVQYVRETLIDAYDKKAAQLLRMHVQGANIGPGASSLSARIDQENTLNRVRISKDPNEITINTRNELRTQSSIEEAAEMFQSLPNSNARQNFGGVDRNVYVELGLRFLETNLFDKPIKGLVTATGEPIKYPDENFVDSPRYVKALRQLNVATYLMNDWVKNADSIKRDAGGKIPQVYKDSFKLLDSTKTSNVEKYEALQFLLLTSFEKSEDAQNKFVGLITSGSPLNWIQDAADISSDIRLLDTNISRQGSKPTFKKYQELREAAYR